MNTMFLSDTCGHHEGLLLPPGDMIIHAGNVTSRGTEAELRSFLKWFSSLNYRHRIFIAGTRDSVLEADAGLIRRVLPSNVIYLEESGVDIAGFRLWGSPYDSIHGTGAFSLPPGGDVEHHWNQIPDDASMIIGRTPAFGVHDENEWGGHIGSKELLRRLVRVEPDYFVCGNVHGLQRRAFRHQINFINASLLNQELKITHKPVFLRNP